MTRLILHCAGSLAVACTLAAPALAGGPDDRGGLHGAGAFAAQTPEPGRTTQTGRPDGREMPDGADLAPAPASPTIVVAADGFDWGDAAIGLAGGLGLALVLGGSLVTAHHVRRVPGAS